MREDRRSFRMTPFQVYKQYLVQVAIKEGRPFALPKTTDSFEKRTDKSFFYVLTKKLNNDGVKINRLSQFMETACDKLSYFHITDVINNYDEIYEIFKNKKENTIEEERKSLKIAFDFLKEYVIIKGVTLEDLKIGSPPVLLKLWKQGRLNDIIIVALLDFNKIKKKSWYRIYCGKIIPKLKTIESRLQNDVELNSFIECELVKINSFLKIKE